MGVSKRREVLFMMFPRDQEYFKDIGSDGKLDPERFPKEETTAHRAFVRSADTNEQKQLRVDYTRRKGEGDTGATQEELQKAVDEYETDVFVKAASDAYAQTKSGYIGKFPAGTVNVGHFSNKEKDMRGTADIVVKEQLEKYQPIDIRGIREKYEKALDCQKSLRNSRWAILFLLIHLAVVALYLLPLIPGVEFVNPLGTERNWLVIIGSCLSLAIAWFLHVNTSNLWLVPGGIHMLLTIFFLGSQESKTISGFFLLIAGAVIVVISVLSVGRYIADGCSRYYRGVVREFKDWCYKGFRDDPRKLLFAILRNKDIIGQVKTPFYYLEK